MTFSDLRQKEVINTRGGRSLGRVTDLVVCPCEGRVTALVVPGEFCLAALLRCEKNGLVIPWERICRIGDDVVLVDGADGG